MGTAWWNLALRFLLELSAFAGLAMAGWRMADGPLRWLLTPALPVLAAAIWGIFAVPGDPSRSGAAPAPVPGSLRLILELLILFGGAAGFHVAGYRIAAVVLAVLVALHYALSWDRISWLLRQ